MSTDEQRRRDAMVTLAVSRQASQDALERALAKERVATLAAQTREAEK